MNLYTLIIIELKSKVQPGTLSNEQFLLLGGLPCGETRGPWSHEQRDVINSTVLNWYKTIPNNATKTYQEQRKHTLKNLDQGNYCFIFEFHTFDNINLECFYQDTKALFNTLKNAIQGMDMVVNKFDSI